jgi:malonate-semialdehyde dehydrogenase (acetylating)/methylmalonate-semialdehyde dehydrogenase
VLVILEADTLDEAIALVNANPNGNGTALFTQSGAAAQVPGRHRRRPGRHQRADPGAGAAVLFTGSRGSKLGDLGPYGKQVVLFYTQTKTVTARWFDAAR